MKAYLTHKRNNQNISIKTMEMTRLQLSDYLYSTKTGHGEGEIKLKRRGRK